MITKDEFALINAAKLDLRFRFETLEFGDADYHVRTLRDAQQCPDSISDVEHLGISSATWSLFGVLWKSEELLSQLMLEEEVGAKRVLEIGCGIALASMVLKRRGLDITATDLNPYAARLLNYNSSLNQLEDIKFDQAGWHDDESTLGKFDLIVGSDLLYDHHNLSPLLQFINDHINPEGQVVLVDPGRGLSRKFARLLSEFGFNATVQDRSYVSHDGEDAKYWVMRFTKICLHRRRNRHVAEFARSTWLSRLHGGVCPVGDS